jgi:hypothetical protein
VVSFFVPPGLGSMTIVMMAAAPRAWLSGVVCCLAVMIPVVPIAIVSTLMVV